MTYLARFLYRNLRGYRLLIFLAVIMTLIEVVASILSVYPFKYILDANKPGQTDQTQTPLDILVTQRLFPVVAQLYPPLVAKISPSGHPIIGKAVITILIMGLLTALLSFVQIRIATLIAKSLTARLSKRLFDHLQRLSVSWHNTQEQGDLIQRVTGNLVDLEKFVADGMVDALAAVLTVLGILAIMFFTNVFFFSISLALAVAMFGVVLVYTGQIKAATKKEKKADGQVSSIAAEAIAKIMEIKAFTLEKFMFGVFSKGTDTRLKAGRQAGNMQAQFTPLVETLLICGKVIIVGIGVHVAVTGEPITLGLLSTYSVTIGSLGIFLFYLDKLYQPMRDLSKLATLSTGALVAAERIQEVLDQQTELVELPPKYQGPTRFTGTVDYQDVYFCYSHPGQLILKGVTLHIPAGKKVALVGLSGSGKTTLTNLLPRFYETVPGWGSVRIDNTDVMELPLAIVRRNISVVLQDSILFDGTIRENIKIGRPNATDAEMFEAAKQACIHETIMKKPDGYDTKLMNQGKNLSGGQRQRIAIARAILRDSPIIIMDEPTASLDVEAEAEVMRALEGLAEGRTVLMITHRLSTVGKVDAIIVLENGRIAEQGTYKELKQKDGVFSNLLKVQDAYNLDADESTSFILTASGDLPNLHLSQAEILIEVDGKIVGKHQLDRQVLTVGRADSNEIVIAFNHPAVQQVSRMHAKILWRDDRWDIQDFESTYGLHYNGQRIEQHTFTHGDRIYLTPRVALVYMQQSPLPPSASPTRPEPHVQQAQMLIEVDEQIIGKRVLDKAILTVGRQQHGAQHDIQIPSRYISRLLHAQIFSQNSSWVIKAAQDNCPLHYNAQPVLQHVFSKGDRVYLAPSVALIFQSFP